MKAAENKFPFNLVDYLSERLEPHDLIFITDHPGDVKRQYLGKGYTVYIVCTRWQLLTKRTEFLSLPEQNIKLVSLHRLKDSFFQDKIFICTDFLETKPLIALFSLRLRRFLQSSSWSVIQTAKTWFWRKDSLGLFLRPNNTPMIGLAPQMSGDLIAISGQSTAIHSLEYAQKSVLAVIAQFNEIDIIQPTIDHLLSQGVDVHIIDNWSSDGSFEVVQEVAKAHSGRVTYERFPARPGGKWEYGKTLERITQVAKERPGYDWIMLNDADEIRWSPWRGVTLRKAFSFIDSLGYSCVDYTVFNLMPTEDGFEQGIDPQKFFNYGEFGRETWYFIQLKTWKNHPEAEIVSTGGHIINFPGRKIFPLKFLLAHYSLRSNAQARKKIFKERQPRLMAAETKKGWNVHYKQPKSQRSFIRSKNGLINFGRKDFWDTYLLQSLTGLGIKRK